MKKEICIQEVYELTRDGKSLDYAKAGTYKDWSAHFVETPKGKICFLYSEPTKKRGNYTRRGDVFVQVTHRPKENIRDVVSFTAGYTFKNDSDVEVEIGDAKYDLFTDNDAAWAKDSKTDGQLVIAMIRGATMVVRGTSSRGTLTTDTYSLNGFTAAYNAASAECGVKPLR